MNTKLENKKLFWKMVNELEGISDTVVKNEHGVVIEKGMLLSNEYSAMYVLDTGHIKIYDDKHNTLLDVDENSKLLIPLKEVFGNLFLGEKETAPEGQAQKQTEKNIKMQGKVHQPCKLWLKPTEINH